MEETTMNQCCEAALAPFLALAKAANIVVAECDLRLLGHKGMEGQKARTAVEALHDALAHPAIQRHVKDPA